MQKETNGTLENWSAVWDTRSKEPHFHLAGTINGKEKLTSRVLSISGNVAQTRNGFYTLGWPAQSVIQVMASAWQNMQKEGGSAL